MGTLTFSKRYGFLDTGGDVKGMLSTIVEFMRTGAPVSPSTATSKNMPNFNSASADDPGPLAG